MLAQSVLRHLSKGVGRNIRKIALNSSVTIRTKAHGTKPPTPPLLLILPKQTVSNTLYCYEDCLKLP